MAFLQVNLMSTSLMRTVPVNVILPVDKPEVLGQAKREENDIEVTYDIGPGAHEWDFWDTYIKSASLGKCKSEYCF